VYYGVIAATYFNKFNCHDMLAIDKFIEFPDIIIVPNRDHLYSHFLFL